MTDSAVVPDTPVTPPADVIAEPVTPVAEPPVAAPVVPETYDLQLPQDTTLDPAVIERTAAIARERGLSNAQAQATIDLLHQEVASREAALLASHAPGGEAWTKQVEGWEQEVRNDTTLGSTPEQRAVSVERGKGVLKRYAEVHPADAEAFSGLLNSTGWGSHPVAARFFAWLGKAAGETPVIQPDGGGGSPRSAKDILYPPKAA